MWVQNYRIYTKRKEYSPKEIGFQELTLKYSLFFSCRVETFFRIFQMTLTELSSLNVY